jgi:SAM-dependent methyltransferase
MTAVSYPDAGNAACYQIEDTSFWFGHRMDCLRTLIEKFPPFGPLYDIGGGNGFVAAALQAAGREVVLLEPGEGAHNALRRGVRRVIQSTMEDAGFTPHSLPAAGAFDVVEHIADEGAFLRGIRKQLVPDGRFYCTVPAFPSLWSAEDDHAGHFRRYTRRSLCAALEAGGFTVEFASYFFTWLTLPVFAFRALPSLLHVARAGHPASLRSNHRLPGGLGGWVGHIQMWELERLRALRQLPFGTSLLCVARANRS